MGVVWRTQHAPQARYRIVVVGEEVPAHAVCEHVRVLGHEAIPVVTRTELQQELTQQPCQMVIFLGPLIDPTMTIGLDCYVEFDTPSLYIAPSFPLDAIGKIGDLAFPYGCLGVPYEMHQLSTALEVVAYRHMQHNKERWQVAAFASIADGVITVDAQYRILFANAAACRLTGYDLRDLYQQDIRSFVRFFRIRDDSEIPHPMVISMRSGEDHTLEPNAYLVRKDGSHLIVGDSAAPIRTEKGKIIGGVLVFRDVTAQHEIEEQLRYAATRDSLTGLLNRSAFYERIDMAIKGSLRHADRQFALLFLDVDNFKGINDAYGHPAGDAVLVEIAHRLRNCARPYDSISRIGGDEFQVLLDSIFSVDDAVTVANRIREAIQVPVVYGETVIHCTVSIGLQLSSGQADTKERLITQADAALYQAKEAGKNGIALFDVVTATDRKKQIEQELRTAVAEHQFSLQYQPIYDLANKDLVAIEVFLRWNQLSPSVVVPLLESTGDIIEVGRWIIEESCRLFSRIRVTHPNILLVLNISSRQLRSPLFIEQLLELLRTFDLPPHALQLEIGEEHFLPESATAALFTQLRDHGFQLSIEDFGLGYASLNVLHDAAVSSLKIDRVCAENASFLRSLLVVAQDLGIQVIAEGIETEAQCRRLQEAGCRYGQGTFLTPPLTAEELLCQI